MNCSPFDVKDYVFGELASAERRAVEEHVSLCPGCREELERLRITETALFALREEELPRRIAFVSDKVFEPRWWQRVWHSAPQLGFASAAMLALAIIGHGLLRPAPVTVTERIDPAVIEARVESEVARRLPAALAEALANIEARQQVKLQKALAEADQRYRMERQADVLAMESNFEVWRQKLNRMYVASSELGGPR